MTKWFVYIVFSLILIPWLSFAGADHSVSHGSHRNSRITVHPDYTIFHDSSFQALADTTPVKKQTDDKKKVKEVTKARHVPKPEKVDDNAAQKPKPKRQRRPPGLERPPEIPRHNGD